MSSESRQADDRPRRAAGRLATALLGAMLVAALAAGPVRGQPAAEDLLPDPQEMARVEASVDRAIEYLQQQQRPNGSWPCALGSNNGVNAICLLAFLGRGHVPGRGPYRDVVDRGVNYLLATQQPNGLYMSPNPSNGPMYEHALATLALTEAHGFIPSLAMRSSVRKAVDLIIKSQSPLGGWRYQPVPADADLSVTVMQIVALRAAMNARLDVPKETIENALKYVRACASPAGGFGYQPGGPPAPARTAAGLLSMQLLGAFDDRAVAQGLDFLAKANCEPGIAYFWYMTYYAMQAHFQAGGSRWANWHPKVRRTLLENQQPDGSWLGYVEETYNGPARCYSTGLAAMALEVYMHYLPAYQR
ncbi:MAG TPA: prenyltransferase/squalene oxidase repeat-containing protein [Phycisphaerae bacterium]|nr:prenyltransferase/squalene oxidase repeat-containing protein [Phycisphaerae bacterium]